MGNEYIDSMLNHTANKLKENSDKLAKTGTFIDRSVNDLALSINAPSEVEMTIPEDGVYVVTASNTWGISNADLATYLGIIHNSGNAVSSCRGNMANGGGLSAACIIDAKKERYCQSTNLVGRRKRFSNRQQSEIPCYSHWGGQLLNSLLSFVSGRRWRHVCEG